MASAARGCPLVVMAVAMVLLTGCAEPAGDSADAVPEGNLGPAPDQDPVGLLGRWRVTTPDPGAELVELRLEPGSFEVAAECGELLGSWRANPYGMFVALPFGADAACRDSATPGWVEGSFGFRAEDAGFVLLDREGEVTARLGPAGSPTPDRTGPPEVSQQDRERYALPAALPDDLAPVAAADLVDRRWYPVEPSGGAAYLEFGTNGEWSGFDGCNRQGGRWVSGPDGALLAVSGVSTLIACSLQVPVAGLLVPAARAGLDRDELVLLDPAGEEVGRLSSVS